MNDLRAAIIEDVRAVIPEGVPVGEERSGTVAVPFVWIRPPDVSRGSVPTIGDLKAATMVIDVWIADPVELLYEVLDALKFLDGHTVSVHGDAHGIRYTEESSTFVDEPDAYRRSILYSITFYDARARSMT